MPTDEQRETLLELYGQADTLRWKQYDDDAVKTWRTRVLSIAGELAGESEDYAPLKEAADVLLELEAGGSRKEDGEDSVWRHRQNMQNRHEEAVDRVGEALRAILRSRSAPG
jgi:hypothetical protein